MELKQVIIVRSDLQMGKGKIAAQSAHASIGALEKARAKNPDWVSEWESTGSAKVVLKVPTKQELLELFENMRKELPCALVHDAGRTQLEPGEITCFACGPAPASALDKHTGKLKLL